MRALFVLVVTVLLIFTPFALIWALNTLFGLGIAYTFGTWLAAAVLSAPFVATKH